MHFSSASGSGSIVARDNQVTAIGLALAKTSTQRLRFIAWFAVVRDFGGKLAATVDHGKYAYLIAVNTINKPKRMNEDFANVGPAVLGNN
jgi:hypothetical protein